MTKEEIEKASDYMHSLVVVLDGHEYKSGDYLYVRDKVDCFCEFMELFGYLWDGREFYRMTGKYLTGEDSF